MSRRITSVHAENVLSFDEVDFDFSNAGFVLVEGLNGSGKSGMVDVLLWCLFGKTLRGYEHDEVIHRRRVDNGCMAKVCLEDGDEVYTITRSRRHPKLKTTLRVTHDNFGEDLTVAGEKETQLVVERVLGCSYKTFLSSVVFGQDRAYRFSSLTDSEQKKILDEVLGVERFAVACTAARKQVSGVQADLIAAQRALERADEAAREAEAEAVDLQAKHVDFEAVQKKKVDAEREKLRAAKDWLGKTRKIMDVDALKAAANDALKALTAAEKRADKWSGVDAEARAAVAGSKVKLDEAEVVLHRVQKSSSQCPTCSQQIAAKVEASVVAAARTQVAELRKSLASWIKISDEATTTLAACRQEVKDARAAITRAQKTLGAGIGADAEAASWRRRRRDHEERIAELEAEVSPYGELAEKARARHAKHDAEVEGYDSQVTGLEGQLQHAEFWVKAFGTSGLRSLLVDTSLPLLNEEAARVSRALTGGAISVEFSATSEQKSGKVVDRFEVRVDNKHGAGDYAGNSSGERAKVDLCVGLALQRLVASRSSASFNLAIFDEVLDHVDSTAHEAVIEVLSELDKETVLVVSHDEDLKAWFPATWRFVKRGDFSTVET